MELEMQRAPSAASGSSFVAVTVAPTPTHPPALNMNGHTVYPTDSGSSFCCLQFFLTQPRRSDGSNDCANDCKALTWTLIAGAAVAYATVKACELYYPIIKFPLNIVAGCGAGGILCWIPKIICCRRTGDTC